MAWGRRKNEEVENVTERRDGHHRSRQAMPGVAQPVSRAASCGWRQIVPDTILTIAVSGRSREKQRHQPGEDSDRDPIISGFHDALVFPPSLARALHDIGASHTLWRLALPAVAAALLTACHSSPPTGQVIAVVGRVDVTLAELNAEARARNLAIGSDRAQRDVAIADLVKRRLLVRAAEARGLDRTPEFVLAERRTRDILLAQQLVTMRLAETGCTAANAPRAGAADSAEAAAQRERQLVAQLLSEEQRTAKIQYQRGFEPARSGSRSPH